MEFGSDYVYMYEEPDFEYISDEEYEHGMNISDSDSDSPVEEESAAPPAPAVPYSSGANLFSARRPAAPQPDVASVRSCSIPPPPPAGGGNLSLYSSFDRADPMPPAPPRAPPLPRASKAKKKLAGHWRHQNFMGSERPPAPPHSNRRVRQGDTNIVTVRFDKLIAPSNMHAGDPQSCSKCAAILSKISKLETDGDHKVWTCEFCETRNNVDIEDEEKPLDQDVTYMLEPALSTTSSGPTGLDESLVVFCVDISGSMCVTTEVPGHIELRGAHGLRRAQQFNNERADQYLPHQRRNVTYISRLQSVQGAIDHQLGEMAKDYPNRRVALVTFSNEVTVIGDGKGDPVSIAGDKLGNKDTLKSIAVEQSFPDAIKNSRQQLGQKLFDLEEGGPTALGPALLVASTMAAKVRGSKVILCTDGLANVGMGKLDNFKDDQEKDEAVQFYEDIAEAAVQNGVSISVITIKGTDCKLVEIGKMADKTGGQVNIVDPLKLTQEFSTILANKIIATNVVATFVLHKELFFFYEDTEESKVVKTIGNVTADTEISFEYGVRTKPKEESKGPEKPKAEDIKIKTLREATQEESKDMEDSAADGGKVVQETEGSQPGTKAPEKMETESASTSGAETEGAHPEKPEGPKEGAEPENLADRPTEAPEPIDGPNELPFQLQIVYTDTEGAKALRVLTQTKPITRDRRKAERLAKVNVLARHTAITAANLAQEGMYTMSRERALMNQRVAWRHTRESNKDSSKKAYKNAFGKIKTVENYLNVQQRNERATRGRTYSDDEDDDAPMAHAMRCSLDSVEPAEAQALSKAPARKTKSFFSRLKKNRSETTSDAGADLMFKGKKPKSFFDDSD